jgi:hypothetical protein
MVRMALQDPWQSWPLQPSKGFRPEDLANKRGASLRVHPLSVAKPADGPEVRLSGRQAALLVLFARPAGARIIAADLWAAAHVRLDHLMMVMVVVVMMVVVVSAPALVIVGVRVGRKGRRFCCLGHDLSSDFRKIEKISTVLPETGSPAPGGPVSLEDPAKMSHKTSEVRGDLG